LGVSIMATWTNVPNSVLEPGDPIRSVDIIAIKENAVYNWQNTTLDILNTQTFTASGTWTKPGGFDSTDTVIVLCIGAGGSGGAARSFTGSDNRGAAGGGAGGGVTYASISYGDAASSYAVTIGAGGTAVSVSTANTQSNGNKGGTTSFGSFVKAGGGSGGGANTNIVATNLTISSASTGEQIISAALGNATESTAQAIAGGNGRGGTSTTTTLSIPYGLTGGGGGAGSQSSTLRTQNQTGGTGRLYGGGGSGATNATGGNGVAPGGGGGGSCTTSGTATSGAGARGEVRAYVVRGAVSAETFFKFGNGV
jgi:hypothetical protein